MSPLFSLLLATALLSDAPETSAAEAMPIAAVDATVDETALAHPAFAGHEDVTERGWLDAVRTVLDEQLSSRDRRRLGRKVLSASRIRIAEGSFPANGSLLVTVNVELRRADPLQPTLFISGAFTLDAAGQLASVVVPLQMRPQRHDLESTGDVDGDGFDDVVLTESGDQGAERHLVSWSAGVPTARVLPPIDFEEGC